MLNKYLANARDRAVPTSEKFTAKLSAIYFRHHVIRQRLQRAPS